MFRELFLLFIFCILQFAVKAQEPFIDTGFGLGQYGYLELDAVTFARLDRNTFNNIDYLRARYFVDDGDPMDTQPNYVYNTPSDWQCSGGNPTQRDTPDFDPVFFGTEWETGADVDVSVYANYCDGTQSYSDPAFDIGFNQRHYEIVDVEADAHISDRLGLDDGNGVCNDALVASFTIDVGAKTDLSLERLFVQNTGTAQEVTHIPNAAFTVFYEEVTGTETFDGNESTGAFMLFGDWGGNPTNNNMYGAVGLNIPLQNVTRIYIAACDIEPGSNGLTVELEIINDGISLGPVNDTSFDLLRLDVTSISRQALILPLELQSFEASREENGVELNWETRNETNFSHFEIERSEDGIAFQSIGRMEGRGDGAYQYVDVEAENRNLFYRLKLVDEDGFYVYSSISSVGAVLGADWAVYYDGSSGSIVLTAPQLQEVAADVRVYTVSGVLVLQEKLAEGEFLSPYQLSANALAPGAYIIQLNTQQNSWLAKVVVF